MVQGHRSLGKSILEVANVGCKSILEPLRLRYLGIKLPIGLRSFLTSG